MMPSAVQALAGRGTPLGLPLVPSAVATALVVLGVVLSSAECPGTRGFDLSGGTCEPFKLVPVMTRTRIADTTNWHGGAPGESPFP